MFCNQLTYWNEGDQAFENLIYTNYPFMGRTGTKEEPIEMESGTMTGSERLVSISCGRGFCAGVSGEMLVWRLLFKFAEDHTK